MGYCEQFSLDNKSAIVTGARRGIGAATAIMLAAAGADVALVNDHTENEITEVATKIHALGRKALIIQADVSKKADIQKMAEQVIAEFGKIDILVNNAGTSASGALLDIPEEEWHRVLDINLKSVYLCCQVVGNHMVERKQGAIINVSSIEGLRTLRARAEMYPVTKAGMHLVTRGLAREMAPFHVRVNEVAPGLIETDGMKNIWGNADVMVPMRTTPPMGGMGVPEQVAGVVVFLASEAASWVTGVIIPVDGGLMA